MLYKLRRGNKYIFCNCRDDEFIGFPKAGSLMYNQSISANMQRVTRILYSAINLTNVFPAPVETGHYTKEGAKLPHQRE